YRITIVRGTGLFTDTNPTILSYAASRTLLQKLPHRETMEIKSQFEALVFSSWNYGVYGMPNLKDFTIIPGRKVKGA
ncbi:MAG: hypothetical protein AAFR59_10040, partial [Bacteroidota bacterium]